MLQPGGVVGLICYPDPTITSSTSLTTALNHLNYSFLKPFFPASRYEHFKCAYADIALPYTCHNTHIVPLQIPLSFSSLLDLVSSWSGFQNYCNHHKLNIVQGLEACEGEMERFLKDGDKEKEQVLGYQCTMVSAIKE